MSIQKNKKIAVSHSLSALKIHYHYAALLELFREFIFVMRIPNLQEE